MHSESIAYELEPFEGSIKVILIEPGAIGGNFVRGSILSKSAKSAVTSTQNLYKKSGSK